MISGLMNVWNTMFEKPPNPKLTLNNKFAHIFQLNNKGLGSIPNFRLISLFYNNNHQERRVDLIT